MKAYLRRVVQEAFMEMITDEWRAYRRWMAQRGEEEPIEFPEFVRERLR